MLTVKSGIQYWRALRRGIKRQKPKDIVSSSRTEGGACFAAQKVRPEFTAETLLEKQAPVIQSS